MFQDRARPGSDIMMMFVPSLCGLMGLALGICVFSERLLRLNCDTDAVVMPFSGGNASGRTKDSVKVLMYYEHPCTVYRFCVYGALVCGFMLFPLIHLFLIVFSMSKSRQRRVKKDRRRGQSVRKFASESRKVQTVEDLVRELKLTLLPSQKLELLERTTKKMFRKLKDEEIKQLLSAFQDKSSKERATAVLKSHNAKIGGKTNKHSRSKE